MDFGGFTEKYLFSLYGKDILLGDVLFGAITGLLLVGIYWLINRWLLRKYFVSRGIEVFERKRLKRALAFLLILLGLMITLWWWDLDPLFHSFEEYEFRLSTLLRTLLVIQVASLLYRFVVEAFNYFFRKKGESEEPGDYGEKEAVVRLIRRMARLAFILLVALVLLDFLHLDYTLFSVKDAQVKVSGILLALLVLVGARILSKMLTEGLLTAWSSGAGGKSWDQGTRYAVSRLLNYFVFTLAILFALSALGVNLTLIWGGAAALMVGVGLGLQQTFNDVFCGILLLFERTVEVGDWVEMENHVGRVLRIGLRTSVIKGRDDISMIVPNSLLVTSKVINWSHIDNKSRFDVTVGVAYGTDTALVEKILVDLAVKHPKVLDSPLPRVRLVNFGDSSLDFQLLFWTKNYYSIEDIKSDLRFEIARRFQANGITIPFPQRDVWLKK